MSESRYDFDKLSLRYADDLLLVTGCGIVNCVMGADVVVLNDSLFISGTITTMFAVGVSGTTVGVCSCVANKSAPIRVVISAPAAKIILSAPVDDGLRRFLRLGLVVV